MKPHRDWEFLCDGCRQEMSTLRQQLAEGTVEESEGRKKLRELEDKVSDDVGNLTKGHL